MILTYTDDRYIDIALGVQKKMLLKFETYAKERIADTSTLTLMKTLCDGAKVSW